LVFSKVYAMMHGQKKTFKLALFTVLYYT